MDIREVVQPLDHHVYGGARIGDVTHMCPDCGQTPQVFCGTCKGRGQVTELELAIWQGKQNRIMAEAEAKHRAGGGA